MKVKINEISKVKYIGSVYNMEVIPNHASDDDQFYVNSDTGIIVHNCHPRDNIALRWLAQEYDIGYDLFDTIMHAREIQAKNLAHFLIQQSEAHNLPIVIHGKAYKPNVPYCIGSYSTLVGHYIKEAGHTVVYVDPLADDQTEVVDSVNYPAVILLAHNRTVTYGYAGLETADPDYFQFKSGSVLVDPFRKEPERPDMTVIHYGNTRR